ncbi:MAG TPA: hypothetical protein VFF63_01710, partial [Candidatus Babeliales bacterium]|nr:hypothetical protein [Candidatus Babeliales bacterium]
MMLPAILLAVTSGALFPAVATYRYDASLNGRPIGVWSVSVKNSGDAFEVDETSSATIAGMQLAATAALVLGPDLA